MKDYRDWFELKPKIDSASNLLPASPKEGEIWWCSIGMNIGTEIDGKNDLYDRPVLVIRVFNEGHLVIVPIRSNRPSNPSFSTQISFNGRLSYALLSQIRAVSSKRFQRYICTVSPALFQNIIHSIKSLL
jgi:mRNA interferase MazF